MNQRDERLLKVQATLSKMSVEELAVLAEYVSESNHGSWDGFTSRDVTGALRMLEDFILYVQNRLPPVEASVVPQGEE